jgi:zinc protease
MITLTLPTPPPARTRARQAEAMLMDAVAVRAVINRLALAQPGSPPNKFGLFIENGEYGHRLFLIWDNFAPGPWRPAIAGLNELTCALSGAGLSEPEWAAAKRDVLRELEGRAGAMGEAPNVELAKDLSHALADGRHLIPPDEMLRHARARLPAMSAAAMNRWWRRQWSAGAQHIRVESPELARVGDPKAAISEAIAGAGCKLR